MPVRHLQGTPALSKISACGVLGMLMLQNFKVVSANNNYGME
jgi:hypothetical protein